VDSRTERSSSVGRVVKVGNPRMEYVLTGQNVVGLTAKLNLSHMELPDGSAVL
jgi:hypothetical protein